MERERGIILEEIKMYKDLPQYYVLELLDGLVWPEHPLGKSLAGFRGHGRGDEPEGVAGVPSPVLFSRQCGRFRMRKFFARMAGGFSRG